MPRAALVLRHQARGNVAIAHFASRRRARAVDGHDARARRDVTSLGDRRDEGCHVFLTRRDWTRRRDEGCRGFSTTRRDWTRASRRARERREKCVDHTKEARARRVLETRAKRRALNRGRLNRWCRASRAFRTRRRSLRRKPSDSWRRRRRTS